ncbi:MAG: erythromycin esterase family protein [Candidatus Symbiothrix sp.]|nr:erythromycin esterase family protein [Candidatus Symbiothrix sp.]
MEQQVFRDPWIPIVQQALLLVNLSKTFHLPTGMDSITIAINNQCLNLSEARMQFFTLNQADDVVYRAKWDINNDSCWTKKTITFAAKDATDLSLDIYLFGLSYDSTKIQKFWIDKIDIEIDNKPIEQYKNTEIQAVVDFDQQQKIELSFQDSSSFAAIPIPDSATIIGIGESMHGSHSFAQTEIALLKNLIQNRSCKLVLLEGSLYHILLWNLFIHEKINTEDFEAHQYWVENANYSFDVWYDFLLWLRQYNQTNTESVSIFGLYDVQLDRWRNPLFTYLNCFITAQNKQQLLPLLQMIEDAKWEAIISFIDSDTALRSIMGDDFYADFEYALRQVIKHTQQNISANNIINSMISRDSTMYLSIQTWISRYGDRLAIVAHNSHLNKKAQGLAASEDIYSLGYYIDQQYKNQYYTLGLFCGQGAIQYMDTCVVDLPSPIKNSIEYLCLQQADSFFFYPTKTLSQKMYYRGVGARYDATMEYRYFGNLSERIDGLIYLSESRAQPRNYKMPKSAMFEQVNILKELKQKY